MSFPSHIFRAYDIRGKASKLSAHVIQAIAHAFAQQFGRLESPTVVLGYDARLSSPQYAYIVQRTLEQKNIHVVALGCCSTPVMYFMAQMHQGHGIMVTASHNAKSDNGLKWLYDYQPPTPNDIQHIRQLAQQYYTPQQMAYPTVQPAYLQASTAYVQYLKQSIQLKYPFKIVVDGMYGSAGQYVASVLEHLGCQLIQIRCDANGNFPDSAPDPSVAENLQVLQHTVIQEQADFGFALDGDGDRVVFVDEFAQIISADRILCFLAQQCLKEHTGKTIVYDVKCSRIVEDAIVEAKGTPMMLRTGSTFLRRYLYAHQKTAVFGGEYAGHYVFNDARSKGYDDGLYTALRLLDYFSQSKVDAFSQLFYAYPVRVQTPDCYIPIAPSVSTQLLKILKQKAQLIDAKLTEIDGIRFDFENGFCIVRASNTGDYLTVRFDAKDYATLMQIKNKINQLIQAQHASVACAINTCIEENIVKCRTSILG